MFSAAPRRRLFGAILAAAILATTVAVGTAGSDNANAATAEYGPSLPTDTTVTPTTAKQGLFIHSSGRFDRSMASLTASVKRLRATSGAVFISGTEAAGRNNSFLNNNKTWAYAHFSGAGEGENYATWNTKVLTSASAPYVKKLSNRTWVRSASYGGGRTPYTYALVVPLKVVGQPSKRTIHMVVVHMPTDKTNLRQSIWNECAASLRALTKSIKAKDSKAEVVIVGDWNKNFRQSNERSEIQRGVASPLGFTQGWAINTPRTGATHGGGSALIDSTVVDRAAVYAVKLLPDDASSDHRPYAVGLKFRSR